MRPLSCCITCALGAPHPCPEYKVGIAQTDVYKAVLAMPAHREGSHFPRGEVLWRPERLPFADIHRIARLRFVVRMLRHAHLALLALLKALLSRKNTWVQPRTPRRLVFGGWCKGE
eukprot:2680925-Pyramimonas_sp.AAC.1